MNSWIFIIFSKKNEYQHLQFIEDRTENEAVNECMAYIESRNITNDWTVVTWSGFMSEHAKDLFKVVFGDGTNVKKLIKKMNIYEN